MSVDLMVVRAPGGVTRAEARGALAALARAHEGLEFFDIDPEDIGGSVYFWHVGRASVAWSEPAPEDLDDDSLEEAVRAPHLVVSARARGWPWVEWLATALARELGAQIFNPQEDELMPPEEPEHTFADLRRLHDETMREAEPRLEASHWMLLPLVPAEDSRKQLVALVAHVMAAARQPLGAECDATLGPEQVNWSSTIRTPSGQSLEVSSYAGATPSYPRTLLVRAEAGCTELGAFVKAMEERLGARFRSVLEYAFR